VLRYCGKRHRRYREEGAGRRRGPELGEALERRKVTTIEEWTYIRPTGSLRLHLCERRSSTSRSSYGFSDSTDIKVSSRPPSWTGRPVASWSSCPVQLSLPYCQTTPRPGSRPFEPFAGRRVIRLEPEGWVDGVASGASDLIPNRPILQAFRARAGGELDTNGILKAGKLLEPPLDAVAIDERPRTIPYRRTRGRRRSGGRLPRHRLLAVRASRRDPHDVHLTPAKPRSFASPRSGPRFRRRDPPSFAHIQRAE